MKQPLLLLITLLFFTASVQASPPDFGSIKDVKEKKATFFNYFYPLLVEENKAILKERNTLLDSASTAETLLALCEKYSRDCKTPLTAEKKEELKAKINVIPPSLALAQAANESAWGTSRFARKANNYFGQWCFKKGCGLVPARRDKGASHEVQKFKHAQGSVRAYLLNLNTGRAYTSIRKIRSTKTANNEQFTGHQLAGGLTKYSERGQAYVKEIRSMISYNKLNEKYDQTFWKDIASHK
jgi:Bax protein